MRAPTCRSAHRLPSSLYKVVGIGHRGLSRIHTQQKEINMDLVSQTPILVAAIQYSILYMLLGGGLFGAIVIYVIAKLLGR
jgi:hypothetical protein